MLVMNLFRALYAVWLVRNGPCLHPFYCCQMRPGERWWPVARWFVIAIWLIFLTAVIWLMTVIGAEVWLAFGTGPG